MPIGLKGNVDGSGAVQVGGTDAITIATDTTVTMNGGVQRPLLSGTAVASTSGTSIDFTGIPSWVKRITVLFNGVSTSATSSFLLQIGTSGGIENTGYSSTAARGGSASVAYATSTAGFILAESVVATNVYNGIVSIALLGSNTWAQSSVIASPTAINALNTASGAKTLAGTLDRVRITTANGTDTFDAGSINILYE